MPSNVLIDQPESGMTGGRRETAPSVMRQDDPNTARILGLVGLMLVALGSVVLVAAASGRITFISPLVATLFFVAGLVLLLFHAAVETDAQVRRAYGLLGFMLLGAAILISSLPFRGTAGALFLPYGYCLLILALLFFLPFARTETDPAWRRAVLVALGIVGLALVGTGFIGGNISEDFLVGTDARPPYAVLLLLLGLGYLWAYTGLRGANTNAGYWTAVAISALGLLVLLIALGRSVLPGWFFSWGWTNTRPAPYLVPSGLVLMIFGLLYLGVSAGLWMENRFMALFRRELTAIFYSPIAYIVLFAVSILSLIPFFIFLGRLQSAAMQAAVIPEPVITEYLLGLSPVLCLAMSVPLLTMRVVSEEHRTGTLEVLFTAPVEETLVVLSKFFALLVFYMLIWIPWGICLISFRIGGGEPFEYRPLLIFYIMVACTGAGFLAMGLFFSSLTRNQIVSGVLTFMAMLMFTMIFFAEDFLRNQAGQQSSWLPILQHVSYLDLWISSIYHAEVTPKFYVFHLSAAVFWIFATVKVLESRKWR